MLHNLTEESSLNNTGERGVIYSWPHLDKTQGFDDDDVLLNCYQCEARASKLVLNKAGPQVI